MASKILVVYYSRSGTTGRAATYVAEALRADLEQIEDCGSRAGFAGYARSALEAVAKGLPTIRTRRDPRDYDLVVLATPVWTGTMSSPMRSYVMAQRGRLQHAAFLAVMGGRGAEQTVREMQVACGAPDGPTCVLTQREVERGEHRENCSKFVQALQRDMQERALRTSSAA